ncbi:MAG TPA: hypothetical protein DCY12_05465 [Candidatus Atribacteria bacterium]|nr:hypothetical protein [Candidatus Atribacteria bacterium]
MGQRKIKKEFTFNLADYEYMDGMPLTGWIWEFKRREKINGGLQNDEEEKFEEEFSSLGGGEWLVKPSFCLKKDYNVPWDDSKDRVLGGVSKLNPLKIIHLKYGEKIQTDKEIDTMDSKNPLVILVNHMSHGNKEGLIMALIDISAPTSIDNILESLKKQLIEWRHTLKLPKTKNAKTPKKNKNSLIKDGPIWKSYLIVYDLIKEGMSFKEAGDLLSGYGDDIYFSEKNIERHYKAAEKMINGGYKKYL